MWDGVQSSEAAFRKAAAEALVPLAGDARWGKQL
jgi:hypothetical protein